MHPPVSPLPQVGETLGRIDPYDSGPKRKYTIQKVVIDSHGQYVATLERDDRRTIPWVIFDTFWSEWEIVGPYSDGLENWI